MVKNMYKKDGITPKKVINHHVYDYMGKANTLEEARKLKKSDIDIWNDMCKRTNKKKVLNLVGVIKQIDGYYCFYGRYVKVSKKK